MKRWDITTMRAIGTKLFNKIYKAKRTCHHNNDIHFMVRDMAWLKQGIESLVNGQYTPRFLKRYYFPGERVDHLHLSDRILQHILLKILKPTFKYVMNPNCYHHAGPSGVSSATQRITQVLHDERPQYFIRADIKSYYKSIPHNKLIKDIRCHYQDPKLIAMLENIITNPIDTPYGYKNPYYGLALRGPLSQFFSGLYLKPLDDAFDHMEVTYFRYQDDILILCRTKRQWNRCKRRLMDVLHERRLSLSRKKTCMGEIKSGFHFLGIQYPPTQTADNTNVTHVSDETTVRSKPDSFSSETDGKVAAATETHKPVRIVPHPRTLRNAREQVKCMVSDEVSLPKIRTYLYRWSQWWAKTSGTWSSEELIHWYLKSCREDRTANAAVSVILHYFMKLRTGAALLVALAANA